MKSLLIWACALSALLCVKSEARRRYKYYLDPMRAEEILAGIDLNQPMSKDRWLGILGGRRDEQYMVQTGDNLWNIATRTVGDPRLWRKLWQMNPVLSNPHELTVGQILAYYREGADPARIEIPLVKLLPNRPGAVNDLDSDMLINPEVKNEYRPSFYVVSEEEVVGEITGAYVEKEWLGEIDNLYVRLDSGETVAPKTRFTVVRFERRIEDATAEGNTYLGMLVRLVGEIEVQAHVDRLAKAELVRHIGVVERGDKIIALKPALTPVATFNPPEDLKARIVMGEVPDSKYFAQGQIVLLNKGAVDGIKEGYLFRVTQDTDPGVSSSGEVGEDYKGEIQVISSGGLSSIGLILRNTIPLLIGDTLVAAQLFPDRLPTPRRQIQEIEIN